MLDLYVMYDQPTTCPQCGRRVEILADFKLDGLETLLCQCLYEECNGYTFLEQDCDYLSIAFSVGRKPKAFYNTTDGRKKPVDKR